jgi:hypothetical protein
MKTHFFNGCSKIHLILKLNLVLLMLAALLIFAAPRAAAEDNGTDNPRAECDIGAALETMRTDPDTAEKTMLRTVEGLIRQLDCNLPKDVMNDIRKDPAAAETIISEKDPACYMKLQNVYSKDTPENREVLRTVVADALEAWLDDIGCPHDRDAILALINNEYHLRELQIQYGNCLMALHGISAAERIFYSENSAYTTDLDALGPHIIADEDRSATAVVREIRRFCCAAASCDPEQPGEAWSATFGLELNDDGNFTIYGYPIGGPDCLILVNPDGDDPPTFKDCFDESNENNNETGNK